MKEEEVHTTWDRLKYFDEIYNWKQ
jgi:hypothetical protein